jgi:hypothetical protein
MAVLEGTLFAGGGSLVELDLLEGLRGLFGARLGAPVLEGRRPNTAAAVLWGRLTPHSLEEKLVDSQLKKLMASL